MIVRCGRCRSELEISGPGEFICPACGTRNVARGGAGPAADPFSLGGVGGGGPAGGTGVSGLTVPGGAPVPPPSAPPADIQWGSCPSCGFRFAMGEVEQVTCPNCRAELSRDENGALIVATQG